MDLISILSEIRSGYNCMDEKEEPYYRALSEAIRLVSAEPEKHTEERTETHARDCISRQAAIDHWRSMIDATDEGDRYDIGFDDGLEFCISDLSTMPSAQQTLYGYEIEHLAYIARVMQKEGVTAEYAVRTFGDVSRASRMIIEELQEKVEKSLSAMQLPFVRKQKEEENR